MKVPANVPLYIFLILIAFFGFLFSFFIQQNISLGIFILFVATGGFFLSLYIFYIKKSNKLLVCPTGSDCNSVIHSEYSKFLGVPLEYAGLLYYTVMFLVYFALVKFPILIPQEIVLAAFFLTAAGFLLSIYLTSVQAFALKKWCMWCLLSAVFSSTIFIVSLSKLSVGASFLLEIQTGLSAIHLLAFAIGIGAVTVAAVLFFRFLKDFVISEFETNVLKTISQMIWFSLAILILTEFTLYFPKTELLGLPSQVLAKIFVLMIVVISGVILNLIIIPWLIALSFNKKDETFEDLVRLRKMTFGIGAVSVGSWYFAFILYAIPTSFEFAAIIMMYFLFLIISISISQMVEYKISKNASRELLDKKNTFE